MESKQKSSKCGIGRLHLNNFQCCASILCFTGIYSLSSLTTSTLQVYISSQITTLEKQFGFTSSQSGFLLSCNDAGFLAVTTFISYRATSAHIPRVLGLSTVLYGLAGILCSFAYFLMPTNNDFTVSQNASIFEKKEMKADLQFCGQNLNHSWNDKEQCSETKSSVVGSSSTFTPIALVIIAIGMILQGVGKSPRSPYVSYYIDENVEKRKTSMYLGVIMTISMFGPALAFGLGAVFNNIYVTLEETDLTHRDPRWIGAWWLGFLAFGIVSILFAVPLFCFPKHFKSSEETIVIKDRRKLNFVQHIKGFSSTVIRLFKNGCFMFCMLGSCCKFFAVAGMITFMPKFLETQFTIPAWHANILMGGLNIFSTSVGTLFGGFIVYKLRLTPYGCIRFVLILALATAWAPIMGFFIGCNNPDIRAFNTHSNGNTSTCMLDCNCDPWMYLPVCGSDNKNYFSYCHAGCKSRDKQKYTGCQCIGEESTASPGLCSSDCDMLYVYISLTFIFALAETITIMPDYIFIMRCVEDKDKAMAVSFRALTNTLLAWLPGPVIFGKVIDTSCRLWNTSCGKSGACSMYDIVDFRYKNHALHLGVKVLAAVLYAVAFFIARRRLDLKQQQKDETELKTIAEAEILLNSGQVKTETLCA